MSRLCNASLRRAAAAYVLSSALACASSTKAPPAAKPATEPARPASSGLFLGSEGRGHFAECYEAAQAVRPNLSVNAPMYFLGRDGKIVFAYLELPEPDRALERCLRQRVIGWELPGPPDAGRSGVSSGGMLVQHGAVSEPPRWLTRRDEVLAFRRRALDAAVAEGALEADAPELDQLLAAP